MSALDIALTVILSYFLIRGVFRGLVKEVVGILGLFVAFWAASVYWQAGADQLKPVLDKESYRAVLSFIVIYMIVYFLVGLMSIFVDKIVKITITPLCSGLLGGIVGLLKGVVLCLILLAATTAFLKPDHIFYTDSVGWKTLKPFCERIKSWVPEKLRRLMAQSANSFTQELPVAQPREQRRPLPNPAEGLSTPVILPTDYASLQALAKAHPELISPAWLEKIASVAPEAVDSEFLRKFASENAALFTPRSRDNERVPPPTWPRQATD
ncbi:MAG: CvpA family protein [Deltaproteobacteria bacterium]|jgi:membrane protein required for colicin V production|nr:CvpA family protein [Deltaproteobacteria bacterium]